jgi:hypothetical protein
MNLDSFILSKVNDRSFHKQIKPQPIFRLATVPFLGFFQVGFLCRRSNRSEAVAANRVNCLDPIVEAVCERAAHVSRNCNKRVATDQSAG